MTQEQLSEALVGQTIAKIQFREAQAEDLRIKSISLSSGEMLTLDESVILSHPEEEAEIAAFYDALQNVPPGGLISFKAKFLSRTLIEREIAKKSKVLKANGYGQRNNPRLDYLTYRFDMPE